MEHDRRFEVFPEFTFYDLNQPLKLSGDLKGTVDRFILDPPFLNADTQTKGALSLLFLTFTSPPPPPYWSLLSLPLLLSPLFASVDEQQRLP